MKHFCPMVLAVGVFSTDKEAQYMWRARLWSSCPPPVKMAGPSHHSLICKGGLTKP